jgi:hypothetical protein
LFSIEYGEHSPVATELSHSKVGSIKIQRTRAKFALQSGKHSHTDASALRMVELKQPNFAFLDSFLRRENGTDCFNGRMVLKVVKKYLGVTQDLSPCKAGRMARNDFGAVVVTRRVAQGSVTSASGGGFESRMNTALIKAAV